MVIPWLLGCALRVEAEALAPIEAWTPFAIDLAATGGRGTPTWSLSGGELPPGVALHPDGTLTGTADVAGSYPFTAAVTDRAGRVKTAAFTLEVRWPDDALPCGGALDGALDPDGLADGEPVAGAVTFTRLPIDDGAQRVEIGVTAPGGAAVFVGGPGADVGDTTFDFWTEIARGDGAFVATLDVGTDPDLETLRGAHPYVPVLIAGTGADTYALTSTCTAAPVLQRTVWDPLPKGYDAYVNFNVYGSQSDVTIDTDDPIPAGLVWDPSNGRITGVPTEVGYFPVDVVVEDAAGNTRTEAGSLEVYEIVDVGCGETVAFGGTGPAVADRRLVARVPTDGVSAVTATFSGYAGDASLAVTAPDAYDPDAGDALYVSTADVPEGPLVVEVSPRSWPALGRFTDGAVRFVAEADDAAAGLSLAVACDAAPRLDAPALPVLPEDATDTWPLAARGGAPPYTWSATGAPDGVEVTDAGELRATGPAAGRTDVRLLVTDSAGAETEAVLPLSVGDDAACDGAEKFACGDTLSLDGDAAITLCHVHRAAEGEFLWLTIAAGDVSIDGRVGLPGATRAEVEAGDRASLVWVTRGETEPVVMYDASDPPLDAYVDAPVFVTLEGDDGNAFTATVVVDCE